MEDYYNCICKVTCGNSSGTGFFLTPSILITASHILQERMEDKDLPINVYTENMGDIGLASPCNKNWMSKSIVALKINSQVDNIGIIARAQDPKENETTIAYGFLSNQKVCDSYKFEVTRNLGDPMLLENCNTRLLPKDTHTNFAGLSGAPLFINNMLVGMTLRQMLEDSNAVRIEAIMGHEFLDYIQECKIPLDIQEDPYVPARIIDIHNAIPHSVQTDSVYVHDGKLYVGGDFISLPEALVPPSDVAPEELPYVTALCEAYADVLARSAITPDNIPTLPGRYQTDFSSQRKSYYAAEWLRHSVISVLGNGEKDFNELEDDAYDGIESTYLQDYDNGYSRLHAVQDKITSTTLEASIISRIRNLMKNKHKKGICHILVNDGKINSWVDIDE